LLLISYYLELLKSIFYSHSMTTQESKRAEESFIPWKHFGGDDVDRSSSAEMLPRNKIIVELVELESL